MLGRMCHDGQYCNACAGPALNRCLICLLSLKPSSKILPTLHVMHRLFLLRMRLQPLPHSTRGEGGQRPRPQRPRRRWTWARSVFYF